MFANVTLSLMGGFVTTIQLFCLTLVFFASAIYNADPFAVYGSLLQGWDGLTGSWAQVSNLI